MVGESHDKEIVSMGVEASLTGHMVFSTLHTYSAPESITRLLDMDIDFFNSVDALLGILAQRLVKNCVTAKSLICPVRKILRTSLKNMPKNCAIQMHGRQMGVENHKTCSMSGQSVMRRADSSSFTEPWAATNATKPATKAASVCTS